MISLHIASGVVAARNLLALHWCTVRRRFFGVVPIIVYQMAKVGSSSIVAALRQTGLPVFHVHRMDAGHVQRMRETRRALAWFVPRVPVHDRLGLRLREQLMDRGERAAMVTLVRDPIARNFSSYFEHLDYIWQTRNAHRRVPMDSLIEGFHTRYTHDEPLTWFDDEMLPVTGIDVYEYPFPAAGQLVVKRDNIELLILRSELADETKAQALSHFTGVTGLTVERANRTSDKSKAAAYRQFIREISLDRAYVDRMLESRYARHFYTAHELDELRARYTRVLG